MSERAYDRLANLLMLVAIGSAVLFDATNSARIGVAAAGVVAGLAGAGLYFFNQRRGHSEKATVTSPKVDEQGKSVSNELEVYAKAQGGIEARNKTNIGDIGAANGEA